MTALLEAHRHLQASLKCDPLGQLALAVSWLDPLWQSDDDWNPYDAEESTIGYALSIIRQAFPDVYVAAVDALRQGSSYWELDRLICNGISSVGIPLDELDSLGFGIPMPFYGIELDVPETYDDKPALIPLLACFGVTDGEVPDHVYTVACHLHYSLLEQPNPRYQQLGQLIGWVFGCTNNSSVDVSLESADGFQQLGWEADGIAFAVEIIREADGIMEQALAALESLPNHPDLLDAVRANVQRVERVIKRSKGKQKSLKVPLMWPHP